MLAPVIDICTTGDEHPDSFQIVRRDRSHQLGIGRLVNHLVKTHGDTDSGTSNIICNIKKWIFPLFFIAEIVSLWSGLPDTYNPKKM
jgi:hypothetical protein